MHSYLSFISLILTHWQTDPEFEDALLELDPSAGIHIFNPTITINNPIMFTHANFHFSMWQLGNRTEPDTFVRTLADIAAESHHSRIDILKIDMERAEYKLIPQILADPASPRIDQILVSIHNNKPMPYAYAELMQMFSALEKAGYETASLEFNPSPGVSVTGSCFWEVVLVNKDSGLLLV